MARGSFVCNASVAGLWLGARGGLWLEVHLFRNASIVGLW